MDAGINYTTSDVIEEVQRITDGEGVDLTYEHTGGELFQHGLDALKKDGRLVTCGAHSGEVVPFDLIPFFRKQVSVIGSFVYTRDEVGALPGTRRARARAAARRGDVPARTGKGGDGPHGEQGVLREDPPHPRRRLVKRIGVDVGGTFTDLIYVDDETGAVLVHKLPTTPEDPSQGTVAGIRELAARAGREPRGARPGVPRHDDRHEHRHPARRRDRGDDHDGGLPGHPPHRPSQEAAQLLELPGPAVAGLSRRAPPPPPDRARAHHEGRFGARASRRGEGARAGAASSRRRGSRPWPCASSSRS